MMKKIEITCDSCGHEIDSDYLTLTVTSGSRSGVTMGVLIRPLLEADRHFCNLECLYAWTSRAAKAYGVESERKN